VRQIRRCARRWQGRRGFFYSWSAEIRGLAERLVKAASGVGGEPATQHQIDRLREILLRVLRDLEQLGSGSR
jgi:hypothetical protein